MNPQNQFSPIPISLKSKFTKGFLRALQKINKQSRPNSCCPKETFRQYLRVRTVADKSLAFAVGSRRAWSRAMLHKMRNRSARRFALTGRINGMKKSGLIKERIRKEEVGFGRAKELRKLVPGGKDMEFCCLLDEAADYIKCLSTQVEVMKSIADFYTN